MGGCMQTTEQFNQAFLAATPEIAAEVLDFTFQMPSFIANNWKLERWTATDNVMQQLVWRGSQPQIERGFNMWKQLSSAAGCEPCTEDCGYNWTTFHGGSFERRLIGLMRREFRTDDYCVNEIKNAHEFQQTFAKIVQNIQMQVQTFKEQNIGFNFLTGIAKKLLVDGGGIKANSQDPYVYRAIGNATLSKLNTRITTKIYEGLRRRTDVLPFDIQNGRPVYAMVASDETMDALYLEDANARADLRFSSGSDALLNRYNFMSSVRGQFLNAPYLYPRRFDVVNGQLIERFPYVNGIPAEVGSFSDPNPQWENAALEEVLFLGKDPFSVFYREQISTIGEGTSFGPEPTFMNQWIWVNVQTPSDPFRRSGFYATAAEIAMAPQFSGGVYGLLVPRASGAILADYFPTGLCPPSAPECTNEVPAITSCPCPMVLSAMADPFNAGRYIVTFATPIDAEVEDEVQIGIATGGYLTGDVKAITENQQTLSIQFDSDTVITNCDGFTTIFCDDTLGCSAQVVNNCDCRSGVTGTFQAVLSNPIKAVTADDVIFGYMGDGTVQEFDVVSVDMLTNTWTLKYSAGFGPTDNPTGAGDPATLEEGINCDRLGLIRVCVPPSTDSTCPECGGPTLTACAS